MIRPLRAAALLTLIAATSLAGQAKSNGVNFNLAAGAALPTGDFGDAVDVGYNLTVGLGYRQPASPLGFRAEGMYNEWSLSQVDVKTHAGGVSANLTYDFAVPSKNTAGNSLYAIGGVGYFGLGNGDNNMGWNFGGGFRFPLSGFSGYVEARYHSISTHGNDISFVPIVFGLVF